MAIPLNHPKVRIMVVSDGSELGLSPSQLSMGDPEFRSFRAGVALTNAIYEDACKIADAFSLACTGPYISAAMKEVLPNGWSGMAIELVQGLARDIMWIVAGAGIGATFGAGLGMLLPPAEPLTVAGGAALGAAIATWALVGIGLVMAGKMVVQLSHGIYLLLGEAVNSAIGDDRERSAKMFARALALILGAAVPLLVIVLLTKTGGRIIQSKTTAFMINRVTTRIAASEIVSAAQARGIGLTAEEWQAICIATRGTIQIFRGCNPNRVAAIERSGGLEGAHFKPGYFKDFKSLKEGMAGEYAVEAAEFEKYIEGTYTMVREGNQFRLKAAIQSPSNKPYLDRTRPVPDIDSAGKPVPDSWGPWLDNHLVEVVEIGGKKHYAMKHPDGKPFVPDIDRLMYAEIQPQGTLGKSGVIKGKKWLQNDDPREVTYWNQRISKALSDIMGREIDWRGFQHGKSADFTKKHKHTGDVGPGWPSRNADGYYLIENESIGIGINGRIFITDWNGLATFIKSIELLGAKFPWAKSIVYEKGGAL